MLRVLAAAAALACSFATPVLSQDGPVPDRRMAISRNVDFPGGDIRSLFDTTFDACSRACLADPNCRALTFNARSNSCFPKAAVEGREPYDGALSAVVLPTDPAVLAAADGRRAELDFLTDRDIESAYDLAQGLAKSHYVNDWTAEALIDGGRAAKARGDLYNAMRFVGSALTLTDAADQWADYADLLLRVKVDKSSEQRSYRNRALPAAINAYLRTSDTRLRATILQTMAQALENRSRGRDMIPALRLALELAPRDDLTLALDDAIGKYGFRITEHEVESDSATPRICAVFNEALAKSGVDYAPFVRLPEPGLTVTHEGRQLCVEGLSHSARYRLTFRSGLPAASGEVLAKDVTLTQYVRDRAPSVRFPGRGYVLPKTGEAALPVVTVNAPQIELTLRRVSDRNLARTLQEGFLGRPLSLWEENILDDEIAEVVWTGTGETGDALNRDVTTRLPMDQAIAGQPAGIYALQARTPNADPYDDASAMQWFVISDLGLATLSGTDGLHVFVRSLGSAEVRAGVTVELISTSNRVLGTALTDAQGYARFAPGLTRGTGSTAPALVTARAGDEDIAFLSLRDPEFDLSDRGVEGREPAPPIDLFLTTDRGAYRAGETLHATALARDGDAKAIAGLPLTAILTRPDGVEYSRQLGDDSVQGGHVFALPIGAAAPRGTWTLALHADPQAAALATRNFLVEDFLPERIDFELTLPEGALRVTDAPPLQVSAKYLFDAPAGDMPVRGDVQLAGVRTLDAYPGYSFGLHDEYVSRRGSSLPSGLRTDAQGRAGTTLTFPDIELPSMPLEARVTVRVSEGSGRPVERRLTRPLALHADMIGIKPLFDGVLAEGTEAAFDIVTLNMQAAPSDVPVKWTLSRVNTRYQWYQQWGSWNWEPIVTRTRIATGEGVTEGGRLTVTHPVDWGEYELRIEQTDGTHAVASTTFYAGWYGGTDASKTPDVLELSLDQPDYRPGDTATVRIVPRYAGKALVTVMSHRLIAMQAVDLSAGENLVQLPVTDEWGAGAYVTATLIRPMDVAQGRNPARALGLSYAPVAPGARQLSARFEGPDQVAPRGPLEVVLKVDGITAGETAYATIAAVDVGILNLTGFQSPDPSAHYFGQRKLGVGMRDIYGRLIDGMNGTLGAIRSGGDAGARMRRQAPPPTEELVAFFSGPLTVDADGYARASFDLPSFNGAVKLMAVAWSGTGVGQAQAEVLVRDPVVVTASLPRFLSPGDESRLLLEVVHATGPAGRMGLDVLADGVTLDAAAVPSGVTLDPLGKETLSIPLRADRAGLHKVHVALTTPEGKVLVKTLQLPVQVNDPETTRSSRFTLAAGQSFTFDRNVFAGLQAGSGSATLAIGPVAQMDTAGLLRALDRYPFGCTEQVTSRAMPLLYLSSVAQVMGLADQQTIDLRIQQSIDKVLTNQGGNGSFGLWYPDSGDLWLDAYVSDFLSRARAQGYSVPDQAFRAAMDNLRNRVNYAPDFDDGGEDLAYALMVLAREGAAAVGDLRYYADVKAAAFGTPMATAQIGAALASYGDQTRADAMFLRAARKMEARMQGREAALWRADYGTDRRDAAAVLALAAESGSGVVDRPRLAAFASGGAPSRSTQEMMWSLMASKALIDSAGEEGFTIDGAPASGPLVKLLEDDTSAQPVVIRNGSPRDAQMTLTTFGVPDQPIPAGGKGYAIERSYYTLEGDPADPSQVQAGTRLVAVLRVEPFAKGEARLMVSDPLPAGFEIDNPNLLRSGDVRALDWLELEQGATHTEFRQDRFLAAIDWRSDRAFSLGYIVRAIAPGSYHHPAASVEDMYRPDRRAWTDAGRVMVIE